MVDAIRFRNARPEYMMDFHAHNKDCIVAKLQTNFRSTPEIVAVSSAFMARDFLVETLTL